MPPETPPGQARSISYTWTDSTKLRSDVETVVREWSGEGIRLHDTSSAIADLLEDRIRSAERAIYAENRRGGIARDMVDRAASALGLNLADHALPGHRWSPQNMQRLVVAAKETRNALEAVKALHREEYGCCTACTHAASVPYPCDTIHAITQSLASSEARPARTDRLPQQPAPAATPHGPHWSLTAPHAVYLDAVVTELMAAGIPPRRVTLATHYDSADEPLRAGLEWDHETDVLAYHHWPRGLTVLWDDSYGWDHVGPGNIPLDPISPPQTITAAIRHLMAHGPGSVHRDRTVWEHAHLLTAISRDRAAHLPNGFWPPDREATPCP